MGKSEKITGIGPETAEMEQKSPGIGKIAKMAEFGSDFKIAKFGLFGPIFWVFFRYLGRLWTDFSDFSLFPTSITLLNNLKHFPDTLEARK